MCDSGTNDQKIRVFKITREREGNGKHSWICKDWPTILDAEFTDADIGSKIEIELAEMTEDQYETLPDFEGW
jgi:hypothetical protein